MLPLLLHLQGHGRYELFSEVLDLLPVLIDFMHNLINLLCRHELFCLHSLWNFVIGYSQSMLEPIHVIFLIFGLNIDLLEHQFQIFSLFLHLLQFYCICACAWLYLLRDIDLQFIKFLGWYPCHYQLYLGQIFQGCMTHNLFHVQHAGCNFKHRTQLCCRLDLLLLTRSILCSCLRCFGDIFYSSTNPVCFYDLLEDMPHVFQLILNPVTLALGFVKILHYLILDHLGHEVWAILCDCIFWWSFVFLSFLAWNPHLCDWPLGLALLFFSSTWYGPLCCLSLFFMFLRHLGVVLLPRPGTFLRRTAFLLLRQVLTLLWLLGYHFVSYICMLWTYISLLICRNLLIQVWNPLVIMSILDGHFYVLFLEVVPQL